MDKFEVSKGVQFNLFDQLSLIKISILMAYSEFFALHKKA